MVNNVLLLLYLSAHFIGDFYFQSPKMAEEKVNNYLITFKHCLCYSVPFFCVYVLSQFLERKSNLMLLVLVIASHCLIDLFKCFLERFSFFQKIQLRWVYSIDQLIHLAIIFFGVGYYMGENPLLISNSLDITLLLARVALFTLIMMKPSNITFKIIFSKYQQVPQKEVDYQSTAIIEQKKKPDTVDGAGALIGNLERLIMGIFLYLQQYAAVGLILTAKSITRYNKIANEPGFSEYYLIGTLYSLFVTLVVFVLIFLVL